MRDISPIVKADGLYVPEPIVVAMFNMKAEEVGRTVAYMIEWTHNLSINRMNEEEMGTEAVICSEVWKEMVRQEYEGGISFTREVADKGRADDD